MNKLAEHLGFDPGDATEARNAPQRAVLIRRMKEAIEGECDGLAITDKHAEAILDWMLSTDANPAQKAERQKPVAWRHRDGMLSCRLPGGGVEGIDWTPLYLAPPDLAAENARLSALADKWNTECDEMREDNKRLDRRIATLTAALEKVRGIVEDFRGMGCADDALATINEVLK